MEERENGEEIENKSAGKDVLVVGIGASAGGVEALQNFFSNALENEGIAYVVILHLYPDSESHLADILKRTTAMPVSQVTGRIKIEPDHVYVISPAHHLIMVHGDIEASPNMKIEDRRAPVDIFFRTLGRKLQIPCSRYYPIWHRCQWFYGHQTH